MKRSDSKDTKDHYHLSDRELAIIETREIEYKNGKAKAYTVEQVKKKILKKHNK